MRPKKVAFHHFIRTVAKVLKPGSNLTFTDAMVAIVPPKWTENK